MHISEYLTPGKKAFLIGIAGVSMAGLEQALRHKGLTVAGSDRALGNEDPALLEGFDFAVRTAAAREDNVMVAAVRARDIPLYERAQAWGAIADGYKDIVCVAGTHGKTTTTGMLAHTALLAGMDPCVMVGGNLPSIGGYYRRGGGDAIILEACEYRNSYHYFSPTLAVVTNIEEDHLDFFADYDDILRSFTVFCEKTAPGGAVLLNGDDPGCRAIAPGLTREVVWYGANGDITPDDLRASGVKLTVCGGHNARNALAAFAAARRLGIPDGRIKEGLSSFRGVERRMELLGEYNGCRIYDDYAHHPTEITAALAAARETGAKRVTAVFQPHTYSRTRSLLPGFAKALSVADTVILTEIYAAREDNPHGVSSRDICALIPGSIYCENFAAAAEAVRQYARAGDATVIMGAGDVRVVGEAAVSGAIASSASCGKG
ncbi:MAG: Mur ligase domain-containing protein [Oscillospiraceae bacterium]|nr:Mur ligase domain-containing protein [Oscillospiraceae bacterium]